jgi:hypothetical protein
MELGMAYQIENCRNHWKKAQETVICSDRAKSGAKLNVTGSPLQVQTQRYSVASLQKIQ